MRDISSIDISKKEELIPSSLSILDGKLERVTTKIKDEDGIEKTISFDSKGNRSINSENIKIRFRSDEENEKINYELRNCIQKNLLNAKPYSEVLEAEKLVERIKKEEEYYNKSSKQKKYS